MLHNMGKYLAGSIFIIIGLSIVIVGQSITGQSVMRKFSPNSFLIHRVAAVLIGIGCIITGVLVMLLG